MHETAPIQAAAWKLVLDELERVAEVCIAISRNTLSKPNNQVTHGRAVGTTDC
jgi:hypothetical protein